jgi:hypothetical protein
MPSRKFRPFPVLVVPPVPVDCSIVSGTSTFASCEGV